MTEEGNNKVKILFMLNITKHILQTARKYYCNILSFMEENIIYFSIFFPTIQVQNIIPTRRGNLSVNGHTKNIA